MRAGRPVAWRPYLPLTLRAPASLGRDECCNEALSTFQMSLSCTGDFLSWDSPGTGKLLFVMAADGIILFALLMAIEYRVWARFMPRRQARPAPLPAVGGKDAAAAPALNEDVRAEAARVAATMAALGPPGSVRGHAGDGDAAPVDVLVVSELRKKFTRGGGCCGKKVTKRAVDGLSFGVPSFECFGASLARNPRG